MPKPSRFLAFKLLGDLPGIFAAVEKNLGIAPPKLDTKYADGLTRAEAQTLLEWGRGVDQFRSAKASPASPAGKRTQQYFDLCSYFLFDHPQLPTGEPAPWKEPLPKIDAAAENPFAELTPAQARDLQAYVEVHPDFIAARVDPKHAQHEVLNRQMMQVLDRATAPDAPAPDAEAQGEPATPPAGEKPAPAAGAARGVAELRADEKFMAAYLDKLHPQHKQTVATMTAAYETAAAGPAARQRGGKAAPAAPPKRDVAALKSDPNFLASYLDKGHPQHKQAVAEMSAAYESAAGATPQQGGAAGAEPQGGQ